MTIRERFMSKLSARFATAALALTSCSAPAAVPLPRGGEEQMLMVDGLERTYTLIAPAQCRRRDARCPLVFGFHGGGMRGVSGNQFSVQTGLADYAAPRGFIFIAPNAHGTNWNDGRPGTGAAADDAKFVREILAALERDGITHDPARVYATGMSNGGHLSFRLGCEMADVFAAIAPVSANLGTDLSLKCSPSRPISVLNIVGMADPISPYAGGAIHNFRGDLRGNILSSDATLAFWTHASRCEGNAVRTATDNLPDDPTSVVTTRYSSCRNGIIVERRAIVGGGHIWPGHPDRGIVALITGRQSNEFDASAVILDFFGIKSGA
jgi:polyhydroxybutyrate depolymerase